MKTSGVRRAAVPLLFLAIATGCGRSCGCVEGEKTYEHLDGKVKVELVRHVVWAGGKIPGPLTTFFVRIGTTPPIQESVACDHVDLAEDDAGKNVGIRCKGTAAWTVVRLRGGDRRLRECNAPVGTGAKPDFSKLGPVKDAMVGILTCEDQHYRDSRPVPIWHELVRSVVEDSGEAAAVSIVDALAARPWESRAYGDPWDHAVSALPNPALATRALCTEGVRADAPAPRYVRAAERCPLDGPGFADGALERYRAELAIKDPPSEPDGDQSAGGLAKAWAAAIAIRERPVEAGKAACAAIAAAGPGTVPPHAALAIARGKTQCPAIAKLFPQICRTPDVDCNRDSGLCSPSEAAARLDAWAARVTTVDDAGVRKGPPTEWPDVLVAAAHVQGALPREVVVPNARRRYAIEAPEGLPSCADDLDAGSACACGAAAMYARYALCDVPVGDKQVTLGPCRLRIDDAHQRLTDAKRVCVQLGDMCRSGETPCCGTARCQTRPPGGYENSRCEAPADAGARDE